MSDGLCVGGWGIGNCGSSGTQAQTQYNQTMNQLCSSTSQFIQSQSSSTTVANFNTQTLSLEIGGDIGPNCDITQNQSINISSSATGNLDAQQCAAMGSSIGTALTNMLNQNASATSQLLSGASSSADLTNINASVQSIVNSTTQLTSYQSILQQTFNTQNATLVVGGSCNGKITQNQSIVANVIALNVLKAVQNALCTNQATANLFTQLSQTSNATSLGAANLLDSLFNGIANVLNVPASTAKTIAIVCAILCCVICLGLLAFMLSPAGQESTTTAVSAGANVAKAKYG
jgi:hypothetical protein